MDEYNIAQKIGDLSIDEIEFLLVQLRLSDPEAYETFKEIVLDETL
jgi:hypothetical protein